MGINGDEKAEAEGKPVQDLEPDAEGPWLGNGSTVCLTSETRAGPPPSTLASDRRMAGGAARGIARRLRKHGYELAGNPRAPPWTPRTDRCAPTKLSGQKQWGPSWSERASGEPRATRNMKCHHEDVNVCCSS
jgi:hypothetical protein